MAENVEDLSADQTEKLLQFQDLTGIDNMSECRQLLERHNWDMEVAVQDRLNEEEGAPSIFNQPQQPEPRTPPVNINPIDQRIILVPRGQPPRGLWGWGYFIVMLPFRFVYSTVMDIFRFFYRLLMPDPRRNVTDPAGDVERFINNYIESYGESHPVFYHGSYSQALNDAKAELRFLLVYLHGDDHQDTAAFCRNTLGNEDVVRFINTSMLFWACNTNSPEGYRVSQALRESTYPFLALIVLRENRMTVVARIEGPIAPSDLIRRLTRVMSDNDTYLVAARAEREERSFNQSLRQEQDQAYLESLRADQEKERKKREEQERIEKEALEEKIKEEEKLKKLQEIQRKKEEIRQRLTEEPPANDKNAIRILIKLPNGDRVERRFNRDQPLSDLHNYVFCHENAPDDFQIVTNFPRKVLKCQPSEDDENTPTFVEAGLGKSEMVFVQDNTA